MQPSPTPPDARAPAGESSPAAPAGAPPSWDSRALLGDAREALIAHADGSIYRLRVTAAGKLILTK